MGEWPILFDFHTTNNDKVTLDNDLVILQAATRTSSSRLELVDADEAAAHGRHRRHDESIPILIIIILIIVDNASLPRMQGPLASWRQTPQQVFGL